MHPTLGTHTSKLILSLGLLFLAAGCTTETKKADAAQTGEPKEEYVWVTETGSRIPKKVKKGTASSATTANEKGKDEISNQQLMMNEAKYTPAGGPG